MSTEEVVELLKDLPDDLQVEEAGFARFLKESRRPSAQSALGEQLAEMARDPQVQSEIREIEREWCWMEDTVQLWSAPMPTLTEPNGVGSHPPMSNDEITGIGAPSRPRLA